MKRSLYVFLVLVLLVMNKFLPGTNSWFQCYDRFVFFSLSLTNFSFSRSFCCFARPLSSLRFHFPHHDSTFVIPNCLLFVIIFSNGVCVKNFPVSHRSNMKVLMRSNENNGEKYFNHMHHDLTERFSFAALSTVWVKWIWFTVWFFGRKNDSLISAQQSVCHS